ncbi:MAG: nicotinamide-nucleotide amidohydrolase family protein [Bacilli bacterium]|nr:nicotinamide-nucleotide amidohydrolase family protein [Bacilli bacterium]
MKEVIDFLRENNISISTMESCTGGGVVNAITNIEGASEVLKFSAITYSNEFKIKMGVSSETINKYSVYSMEVAHEMAKNISSFTNSDIGIGITGKLNRADINNNYGKDNQVFVSIFYKNNYYDKVLLVEKETRAKNKETIIEEITNMLKELLWK